MSSVYYSVLLFFFVFLFDFFWQSEFYIWSSKYLKDHVKRLFCLVNGKTFEIKLLLLAFSFWTINHLSLNKYHPSMQLFLETLKKNTHHISNSVKSLHILTMLQVQVFLHSILYCHCKILYFEKQKDRKLKVRIDASLTAALLPLCQRTGFRSNVCSRFLECTVQRLSSISSCDLL